MFKRVAHPDHEPDVEQKENRLKDRDAAIIQKHIWDKNIRDQTPYLSSHNQSGFQGEILDVSRTELEQDVNKKIQQRNRRDQTGYRKKTDPVLQPIQPRHRELK